MLEQNSRTKWIAIFLGTQGDAEAIIDKDKQRIDNA